jgi:hypothetical protein
MKSAVLLSLLTTACVGSLTGGDTDPPDPPQPPPPPPPPSEVAVRVHDGALPATGVKVIFQAADDSVIADVVTDADGRASAQMPNGGNLTVIRTYPASTTPERAALDHVYTYLGVKPGDTIDLAGTTHDISRQIVLVTVNSESTGLIGVTTPCGSGYGQAPTIQVELQGCGSETDFFVTDYSPDTQGDPNEIGGPQYFAVHAPITPEIDFSGETFRGTLATDFSATGALALQTRLVMGTFTVFDSGTRAGATTTIDVPELPAAEQIVTAYVSSASGMQMVSQRAAYSSAPVTVDVTNTIPASNTPTLSGDTLSWMQKGTGTPDLAIASITVAGKFTHSVAAAYSGMSMRVPHLPAAYDLYNVQTTDTPSIAHNLVSVTGGYDGVRARVFNHALTDLAPMGGSAIATYLDERTSDPTMPPQP